MNFVQILHLRDRRAGQASATESGTDTQPSGLAPLRRWRIVLKGTFEEWLSHRAASKGAALAFYTVFSMAPLLVLVIAIAGLVFGEQAARGEISVQLTNLIGPAGAGAIELMLASGGRNPGGGLLASLVAAAALLVGATTAFSELKESLDEIWRSDSTRKSGLAHALRTRMLSFGLVLVLAFFLLASILASAALALLARYFQGEWSEWLFLMPATSLLSFGVTACLFAVIYKMLPQIRLAWRDVWVGAIGTAGLFILGKYLIGLYLTRSGIASSYGAAGSVLALLMWVYYSAQLFFFGAEFTRQYALWFGSLQSTAAEGGLAASADGADDAGEVDSSGT